MDKCVKIVVALAITGHIVTGRSYIPDVRHKEAHRGYDYPAPYHHHPPGRWHHDQDWAQSSSSSSGSYGRPSSYQKEHKPHKHQHNDKDWNHHSSGSSSSSDWDSGSWEYPDYPGHGSPDWSQHSWGHGHGHGKPQHQQWPQYQPGMDWTNKPNRDHDRPSNTAGTNPQTSPRATSESEDLLAQTVCIRSCPVTSEYNPVCGSNNVTYSNPGRLECAKFCGVVTGTLKPTPLAHLYPLAGIAPPSARRYAACWTERLKQQEDARHTLFNHIPATSRLKSRKSFLGQPYCEGNDPSKIRLEQWAKLYPPSTAHLPPAEKLPPGGNLPWAVWKSLNRLRAGVGRCHVNRKRWGFSTNDRCDCGALQTMSHLLSCPTNPCSCTLKDLQEANDKAIAVATHWSKLL